jgi:tetratricopeptide (TPR) repeat protein
MMAPQRPQAMLLLAWLLLSSYLLVPSVQAATYTSPAGSQVEALMQQSMALSQQGQQSQAITLALQALPLANPNQLPVLHNNLAALYLRRGDYLAEQAKQPDAALVDYRQAYFYMGPAWPVGVARQDINRNNLTTIEQRLALLAKQQGWPFAQAEWHEAQAANLRRQGQFQQAIAELALATQRRKTAKAEPLVAMGDMFTVLNQPYESAYYYGLAVQAAGDKADDDWLVRWANALIKANQPDQAIAALNKVSDSNPNHLAALKLLEGIWQAELANNPNNGLAWGNLASLYQKRKLYAEAANAYARAEQLMMGNAQVPLAVQTQLRLNHATLMQQQGRTTEAETAYKSILQRNPQQLDAAKGLAQLYDDTGRPRQALDLYHSLLLAQPTNEALQTALLARLDALPQPDQRLAAYQNASVAFKDVAGMQALLGERYHQAKQVPQAIALYRRAVALNPSDGVTWANLAVALKTQPSEGEAAVAALQQATRLLPERAELRTLLAQWQQGQAVQTKQANTQATLAQLQALYDAENWPELLKQAKGLASQQPALADAWYYVGLAQAGLAEGAGAQRKAMYTQALEAYSKALALPNPPPEAYYAMALAQEAVGNTTLAKQHYQRFITVAKPLGNQVDSALVAYAQERLEALR